MRKFKRKIVSFALAFLMTSGVLIPNRVVATMPITKEITLQVYPGDGYILLWERNKEMLPPEWTWQDLENACDKQTLMPGTLKVSIPEETQTTAASTNYSTTATVQVEVKPDDGYWSVFMRNRESFPAGWTWQDLEKACGYQMLKPGILQVPINTSGAHEDFIPSTPNTTDTVQVEVEPGEGYWAVFMRNRESFPAGWTWQDLEKACGYQVLIPGVLQVCIDGESQSTFTEPTVPEETVPVESVIGTCSMASWCDEDSWHNIVTSAQALDGLVIPAWTEFNWFYHVGSCTSWPYKEAPIQPEGKAYGGGICFTSTVLYQSACLSAGMEKKERHNHQNQVSYAELGTDSALNYSNMNQRWLNNTNQDVRIDTYINGRELTINIVSLG